MKSIIAVILVLAVLQTASAQKPQKLVIEEISKYGLSDIRDENVHLILLHSGDTVIPCVVIQHGSGLFSQNAASSSISCAWTTQIVTELSPLSLSPK